MANHAATVGLVKIGTVTIGELRSYSLSESVGTIEDTTLGDTSKTYKAGQTTFSGSCEMFWDETDNGQNAVTIGAAVVLNLYPGSRCKWRNLCHRLSYCDRSWRGWSN